MRYFLIPNRERDDEMVRYQLSNLRCASIQHDKQVTIFDWVPRGWFALKQSLGWGR